MKKNLKILILSAFLLSASIWIIFEMHKSSEEYIYANSYRQNSILNTIRLHKYGITGKRIKIGIIDAGFYTGHPVFANTKIVKEFDFVSGRPTTADYNHIKGMDHGTNVFSIAGGNKVNELIGIAYGASFLLAKTDISTDRLMEEEINAAKAAVWLKENGAQIVTTSLSFKKFDDAGYYYPSQMNGQTALITRTADSLYDSGILFIASAGNDYEEEWKIIEPPGDGFHVLSVGSVDKYLKHSFFSSCGPTTDGRIKPDLTAPGEGVWAANYFPKQKPEFGWSHGTSLAAPAVAGVAALVLSAHPDLSPAQVTEAVKNTASNSRTPDNLYGWGIPDAEKAVSYFGPAFSNDPIISRQSGNIQIKSYVFSSYGLNKEETILYISIDDTGKETAYKMKQTEANLFEGDVEFKSGFNELKFRFTAEDLRGKVTEYPSGILGKRFLYTARENTPLTIIP